jgi:hypothetical protein
MAKLIRWAQGRSALGCLVLVVVCAAATVIAARWVRLYSKYASSSGIPQVEAVFSGESPPARGGLILVKFVGGALAIGREDSRRSVRTHACSRCPGWLALRDSLVPFFPSDGCRSKIIRRRRHGGVLDRRCSRAAHGRHPDHRDDQQLRLAAAHVGCMFRRHARTHFVSQ